MYFESLNSMRIFCFYLGILEIIIKKTMLALVVYDYRSLFPNELSFLLTFDYKIKEIPHEDPIMMSSK